MCFRTTVILPLEKKESASHPSLPFRKGAPSLWHQNGHQKQKSNKIKGFKPWEIRWCSSFFSGTTGTVHTERILGSFLHHVGSKILKNQIWRPRSFQMNSKWFQIHLNDFWPSENHDFWDFQKSKNLRLGPRWWLQFMKIKTFLLI